MARVEVLFKGYYRHHEAGGQVCSTVTLVIHKDLHIVVDPGTLPDAQILVDALGKHALTPQDIDVVVITHSHMDHYRYAGLFTRARVLDYWGWWQGDQWNEKNGMINPHIETIPTPGHSEDSLTLLVKTGIGRVAICGDVFWDKDFPKDDPFASHRALLNESREKVLQIADYIVPGHGDIFKVD